MLLVGVPIDCSGAFIGVERMPAALRQAGLVQGLGARDLGDWPVTIDDPTRDPVTGIIGFESVYRTSQIIQQELAALLPTQEKILVVGGCCTLLIGVMAALRQQIGEVGLAFIDGHLDFYSGQTSPTGEAADMELAILAGLGPQPLTHLAGVAPLVNHSQVAVIGYRDEESSQADGAPDPKILAPAMHFYDVPAIRAQTPSTVAEQTLAQFDSRPFWLHLDVDVLDESAMPAVDYLMPNGLGWQEMIELARPLAQAPNCIGMDVTIYNPTLDPDGRYARQLVDALEAILQV